MQELTGAALVQECVGDVFDADVEKLMAGVDRQKASTEVNETLLRQQLREQVVESWANEQWVEGTSPFGIPKTRIIRWVIGKKKKKKAAEPAADAKADKKKAAGKAAPKK